MRHWVNNVNTQNTVIINPGDTTIVVQDDSRFPNNVIVGFDFGTGDTFLLTLRGSPTSATPNEIVEITGNPSGTSYNVTRAQEGTSAQQWPVGSVVEQDLTAAAINDFETGTGTPSTVVTDSSLAGDGSGGDPLGVNFGPNAFGLGGASVLLDNTDDLDTITAGGDYHWLLGSVPSNAPTSQSATMHVVGGSDATTGSQFVVAKSNEIHWRHKFAASGFIWTSWQTALRSVSSNNTLVGTGTPSSPLGVNTNVFETQINTDTSLDGDGSSTNILSVANLTRVLTQVPGNQTIDLNGTGFIISESYINFTGSGLDFDITLELGFPPVGAPPPQGRKVHIVNHSDATATVIAGSGVNWIDSPVGSNVDIPPNSGLITILVTLDFAEDLGLAFQGGVVATP